MRKQATRATVRATDERLYVLVRRAGKKKEAFAFETGCGRGGLRGSDLESVLLACGVRVDYDTVGCDCNDRSWYGEDHDTACPVALAIEECE